MATSFISKKRPSCNSGPIREGPGFSSWDLNMLVTPLGTCDPGWIGNWGEGQGMAKSCQEFLSHALFK